MHTLFGSASLHVATLLTLGLCLHSSQSFSWNQVPSVPTASNKDSVISFDALKGKKVLVVGGSGRVGGSVVTQLILRGSKVVVGGTNAENFKTAQQRWQALFPDFASNLRDVTFSSVERERAETVQNINDYDLVVHTAGPFQGKVTAPNGILQVCIDATIPYIDVCDDYCTASAARTKYAAMAKSPCILSTGTWPGVSSLMAKQLVSKALNKYPTLTPADLSVDFAFFTAGSGGAGVTLLVATFLILAEQALTIVNGRRTTVPPLQNFKSLPFGTVVGPKSVAPLNLLETASIHDTLGVGNVSAKFGTAPFYWNALLGLFGSNVPREILENEPIMRRLSAFSMSIVRLVDYFAGATNAIRVDLRVAKQITSNNLGKNYEKIELEPNELPLATAIYAHENLEPCVGECIVAFAAAILSGVVPAGVWFPEQAIPAGADAAAVLELASIGAHTTTVDGPLLDLTRDDVFGSNRAIQQQQPAQTNGEKSKISA